MQQVPSPAHGIVTQEMLNEWIKEQFALETNSQLVINSIERKEESKDTHHYVSTVAIYCRIVIHRRKVR